MPQNKNQHYVSRFYLKNFSPDPSRKTVHLYNINRDLFKNTVGIYGQCSQPYFYGKDLKLETALRGVETKAAIIINTSPQEGKCPEYDSVDHMNLLYFISLQRARTKAAELQTNALIDANVKLILEKNKPELGSLDNMKISLRNSVQLAVASVGIFAPLLWDMEIKLITIDDESEFYTSDHPTVFFNQFFQYYKFFVNGLASRGLQIFIPISPKKMLMAFDGNTYEVGEKHRRTVRIHKTDVAKLNILQYLGARDNIYFTDEGQKREIEEIRDRYNVTRIEADEIIEKKTIRVEGSSRREVTMTNLRKTSYRFAPEFVVMRKLSNRKVTPGVRDEYRYQISKEVSAKTLDGTLTAEEIPRFCVFHPLVMLASPPTWRRG